MSTAAVTGRRPASRLRRATTVLVLAGALVAGHPTAPAEAAARPGKPKVLKVFVKGTSTLQARWSTAKGATRYQVLVATNKKMTKGRKVLRTTQRTRVITGLRQGTTYYVKVRAYRGKRLGSWGPRKAKRTLYATPSTPSISARGTGFASAIFRWTPATYATRYRVVITRGPGMAVVYRAPWQYSRAKQLTTLRALPAGSFYYARVEASNAGKASRYSAAAKVLLRPYSPRSPEVAAPGAGSATATWTRSTNAERYQLQARAPGGAAARTVTTNHLGEGHAAVNGLPPGVPYRLYVRAMSGSFASPWVDAGTATAAPVGYRLRVGSYNVTCADPGTRCSTTHPWLSRRAAVAKMIAGPSYDVIGLQELSTTKARDGQSQAAGLNDVLSARYKYAPARGNGRWTVYNSETVEPVGAGGMYRLGTSASNRKMAYAYYQVFEHKGTGSRFGVVNAHLEPFVGAAGDSVRLSQTRALAEAVRGTSSLRGMPVLYVGDFNSHEFRGFDAPRAIFNQLGMLDGDDFAATRTRWWWNSANGWRNPNPRQAAQVDHVYVPRSVGVRESAVDLDVTASGRWRSRIPSDHNPVRVELDMPAS